MTVSWFHWTICCNITHPEVGDYLQSCEANRQVLFAIPAALFKMARRNFILFCTGANFFSRHQNVYVLNLTSHHPLDSAKIYCREIKGGAINHIFLMIAPTNHLTTFQSSSELLLLFCYYYDAINQAIYVSPCPSGNLDSIWSVSYDVRFSGGVFSCLG